MTGIVRFVKIMCTFCEKGQICENTINKSVFSLKKQ